MKMQGLSEIEERVQNEVEEVIDLETDLAFGKMSMIINAKEQEPEVVKIDFAPSSPFCSIAFKLTMDIKNAAKKVKALKKALVYCHGHTTEEIINRSVKSEEITR